MAELNQKSERRLKEKETNLNELTDKIELDIKSYNHFQKVKAEEKASLNELSEKIVQQDNVSPLFLLDIKERNLMMELKALEKKEDLLREYLKHVLQSNKMCGNEFTNFLDR